MRERRAGLFDRLIEKATKSGLQTELATLLGVSRFSVYKWNLGQAPSYFHQVQINALCGEVKMKPLYKLPFLKKLTNGHP